MMQWQKMLIVDLECTCFRPGDPDMPTGWTSEKDQEITEIGAVVVNLVDRSIIDSAPFLVRPDGPMGVFCKELTSLTFDDVCDKPQLAEALEDMKAWCKYHKVDLGQHPWGSWGDYDRVQFFRECARKGIGYPFGRAHYNVKGLFSMQQRCSKGFSVEKALARIDKAFVGRPHRGIDDALNIADLLLHTLRG